MADAVEDRAALHLDPRGARLGETHGIVGLGEDRLADVPADLAGLDVEGRGDLDVADMVAAEIDVHDAGRRFVVLARRA